MAWAPSRKSERDLANLPENSNLSDDEKIRNSLALMERIQQIAGTRPPGHRATMADWDDESTVEREVVAMMRYFDPPSMDGGSFDSQANESLPQGQFYIMRRGNESIPMYLDDSYFDPCRKRKLPKTDNNQTEPNDA